MSNPDSTQALAEERTLSAEVKLYYDVHKPAALPAPLLIALHGYGANKRQMMREALALAPEGFAVASLQGFHQHMKEPKEPGGPLRFGFGWLTNFHPEDSVAIHHQALLDLIATLTQEGVANQDRIFLLGFSQTCALDYRFAFTHPDILRGVIGICGGIPGDWKRAKPTSQLRPLCCILPERAMNIIRRHASRTMKSDCGCALRMSNSRVTTRHMKWCRPCVKMSEPG